MSESIQSKSNVILIGFMGCGKTTIGNKLAEQLQYSFIDSDEQIEQVAKMSISDIFQYHGEEYFRALERAVIENISDENCQVVATGGGVIKDPVNVQHLRKKGVIIYLQANPEHIYNNLKEDDSRPLLQGNNKLQKIKDLLEERKSVYEASADWIIPISQLSVEEIVEHILIKIGDNT